MTELEPVKRRTAVYIPNNIIEEQEEAESSEEDDENSEFNKLILPE